MKILVKAKPGSKEDKIEKIDEFNYVVFVKEPARHGKANTAIIGLIADYFKVSRLLVEIRSGLMAKTKVVMIHI